MGDVSAAGEGDDRPVPGTAGFDVDGFMERHYATLRRRAHGIVSPPGDPRDVLHEVYLRLRDTSLPVRHDRDALAFCVTNLRWVAADQARRRAYAVPVGEFDEAAGGTAADPANVVTERAVLDLAHSLLSARQRVVWTAIEIDERSQVEVASQLGVTVDAVRSTLHRAWERLRANAEEFRSIVAGVLAVPWRRRPPVVVRHEPAWLAASGALAATLLAVTQSAVVPPPQDAGSPTPAQVQLAPTSPDRGLATGAVWPVREGPRPPARRSAAVFPRASGDTAPPSSTKTLRCVARAACLSASGDGQHRYGHGVGVRIDGPLPRSYEAYTGYAPLCDAVDPALAAAPEQSAVTCTRHSDPDPLPPTDVP